MGENFNHTVCSKGDVPFSWEHKPGVSKVARTTPHHQFHFQKLPPPPCGAAAVPAGKGRYSLKYHQDLQIPPPPCTFRQPAVQLRNSSQKAARDQDDPFLIAYMECTKTVGSKDDDKFVWFSKDEGGGVGFGVNKMMKNKNKKKKNSNLFFSCKNSCSVMEDKIVKMSQLPMSRSHREEWSP